MLYTQKEARLREMQASLAAKQQYATVGEQLENFKARNPTAANAVAQAVRALEEGRTTPEQVLAALRGQDQSQADDEVAHTRADADPKTRGMLDQIAVRQQALERELEGFRRKDTLRERTSEIDSVLASDEVLRHRPKLQELVRERIQRHLDDGKDLAEATLLETTRARELLAEQLQSERDQRLANQDLKTTSPSVGTPLTRDFRPDYKPDPKASPRDRTAASLKAVSAKAREFLNATMRGAVSGPQ